MEKHEWMSDDLRKKMQQTLNLFHTYLAQAQPQYAQYQFPKTFEELLLNIFALPSLTEVKQ